MRFITEFEQDNSAWDQNPAIKGYRQLKAEEELGHFISISFGFSERGETTLSPDAPVVHKHRLEIEAFPMDKWIEFKKRVLNHLLRSKTTMKLCAEVEQMFKELESFGKPAGEAK